MDFENRRAAYVKVREHRKHRQRPERALDAVGARRVSAVKTARIKFVIRSPFIEELMLLDKTIHYALLPGFFKCDVQLMPVDMDNFSVSEFIMKNPFTT